jgi:hypothetical protein
MITLLISLKMTRKTIPDEIRQLIKSHDAVAGYLPYRNCLAYMQQKSSATPGKKGSRFMARRAEWDQLRGTIPLSYLKAIGADPDVLMFCIGLDAEEFENHLYQPKEAAYCMGFYPGEVAKIIILSEKAEPEAIGYVHDFMKNNPRDCICAYIQFSNMVTHYFLPVTGHQHTLLFYPRLIIENNSIRRDGPLKVSPDEYSKRVFR